MAKPAFPSFAEHTPSKPVIIIVPPHYIEDCPFKVEEPIVWSPLDHIVNPTLPETLRHGIGYYPEALDRQEGHIVERPSESGAVQVLIAPRETAWSLLCGAEEDHHATKTSKGFPS